MLHHSSRLDQPPGPAGCASGTEQAPLLCRQHRHGARRQVPRTADPNCPLQPHRVRWRPTRAIRSPRGRACGPAMTATKRPEAFM